jgi:hypothetical protein
LQRVCDDYLRMVVNTARMVAVGTRRAAIALSTALTVDQWSSPDIDFRPRRDWQSA